MFGSSLQRPSQTPERRGHYERGVFTESISGISSISTKRICETKILLKFASGTGDSQTRFARIDLRESFAIETPILYQRAENGGLDPSWLNLAFLGHPDSQSRGPKILVLKGFGDLWTENRGAPKTPNSTTTDPTPHSRPSDYSASGRFARIARIG